MNKINKVSERELFSVLGVLRLNSDITKVLETTINLIKSGDISEEKLYSMSYLEGVLCDTKEQLEEYYGYLDIIKNKLEY